MRILVVEDGLKMAGLIRRGLEEEGYAVDIVHTGADAVWTGTENPYDAIVLDLMLPDLDGFEVCRQLRRGRRWAPIIMLTARDAVVDRVSGLDAGADDYLTKPFAFSELLARLRALIRRGPGERPAVLASVISPSTRPHTGSRAGQSAVDLTAKEFALLEFLMRRPGQVLTRTQILEHVWDFAYEGDSNVVDVYIRYLREKVDRPFGLEDDRDGPGQRLPAARGRAPVTLTIRARLALVCAALVGAMVVGLGAIVYLRLEADLRAAADDGLVTRAEELISQPVTGDTIDIGPSDVGDIFAQIMSADGRVVATTPGLEGDVLAPSDLATTSGESIRETVVQAGGEPLLSRVLAARQADGTILILGVAFDDQREALDRLLGLLVVVAPLAAALAAMVGWVVAAAALRPVERMRRESEAISGSEPSRRLEVPATRDELAELGASLNRMLDRLEAALLRERRFVDDASHELRTPLANLKVELELALRRSRTPDELQAALRSAAVETDRLTSLAEDLLVLARAADGRLPIRREEIDLGPLVGDVTRRFAGRAEARGITMETSVDRDGTARVDEARVRQALGNLIENALVHTPPGGRITVGLTHADGSVSIAVADTGAGFPVGFVEHAFEPFSRADAARSPDGGGTGLGLAIVRVVAEGHGGSVEARNNPGGGATVELTLPA